MALSTVVVTWDETDIGQGGLNGSVRFSPSGTWTDTLGGTVIEPQPLTFPILASAGQTTPLVANDSAGLLPAGSYYVITVQVSGLPPRSFNAFINFANGASQTLGSLNPLAVVPAQLSYLPLPTGTPTAGQVPVATGSGELSAWGPVSGQYLCAPSQYAPGSQTPVTVSSTTPAAFSTGVICTNSFIVPASGSVIVSLSCVAQVSAAGAEGTFALAAAGTVTPIIGKPFTTQGTSSTLAPVFIQFYVTGLTPGSSHQFDLLGAATSTDTLTIYAHGASTVASKGAPVLMTVQAI